MAIDIKNELFRLLPDSLKTKDSDNIMECLLTAVKDAGSPYADVITDNIEIYLDPLQCPEHMLAWLASFYNFPIESFAIRFGWDTTDKRENLLFYMQNANNTGSIKGIKLFVEKFIKGAIVETAIQPYHKLNRLSVSTGISTDTRIRNKTYWRDVTVDVKIWNPGQHISFLLEWLIDPRVLPWVTFVGCELSEIDEDYDVSFDNGYMMNADTERKSSSFKLSNTQILSGEAPLGGYKEYSWNTSALISNDFDQQWPIWANSIWSIPELASMTFVQRKGLKLSGSGTLSGYEPLSGAEFWDIDMTNITDNTDYFGGVDV